MGRVSISYFSSEENLKEIVMSLRIGKQAVVVAAGAAGLTAAPWASSYWSGLFREKGIGMVGSSPGGVQMPTTVPATLQCAPPGSEVSLISFGLRGQSSTKPTFSFYS